MSRIDEEVKEIKAQCDTRYKVLFGDIDLDDPGLIKKVNKMYDSYTFWTRFIKYFLVPLNGIIMIILSILLNKAFGG